jgi:hypothetical protein
MKNGSGIQSRTNADEYEAKTEYKMEKAKYDYVNTLRNQIMANFDYALMEVNSPIFNECFGM